MVSGLGFYGLRLRALGFPRTVVSFLRAPLVRLVMLRQRWPRGF